MADDSWRGGEEGGRWETDLDKLAGVPTGPELGNRGGGGPVGGLLMGILTLVYHIDSLNTWARILASLEQSAQNLTIPKEENQI